MNYIKRLFRSMLYHKKNTVLLLLIFLILSALILLGLTIQAACEQSIGEIRGQIGASVVVANRYTLSFETDGKNSITRETVQALSEFPEVKQADYTVLLDGYAVDFEPLQTDEQKLLTSFGNIRLSGETSSAASEDFRSGAAQLTKGSHIKPGDQNGVVIHESLANELCRWVGGEITVKSFVNGKESTLEIVGLYTTKTSGQFAAEVSSEEPENKLYIPAGTAFEMTGGTLVSSAVLDLYDPVTADDVVARAKALPVHESFENSMVYHIDDTEYRNLSGSFTGMQAMVAASVFMGSIVLVLLTILNMKPRDFEIGILLSMGESKWKIILQLMLEMLIPVFVSITASVFINAASAEGIGRLLSSTITVSMESGPIIMIYLFGLCLTVLASCITAYKVVQNKPKDMLMRVG